MRGRRIQAWSLVLGFVLGICPGLTPGHKLGQTPEACAQTKKGADKTAGKKPVDTSDPEFVEFQKHFTAGQTAAKANRWDAARQEFLAAFDLKPDHAATVALLAQAEMATGRHREAAEHLEIFLDYAVGLGPEDRKTAEDLLVEAQSKLAIVTVKVDKPGAKITVDGRVLGTSPLSDPVLVDAGQGRRFEAETPDGWRGKLLVDLQPRTTPTVDMVLKAPLTKIVKVGQAWRTPLLFTGIGLSVVGIGAGVGFIVAGSSKNSAAIDLAEKIRFDRNTNQELCPATSSDSRCSDLKSLQRQSNTFGTIAIAGFAVGGVAAIGTAVLALTAPKQTTPAKKNALMILPSPGGILVTGTF